MGNEETAEARPSAPKPQGDPNRYGLLIVNVIRGVYLTPHNDKRDMYVRVGWADPKTHAYINESDVKRSNSDRSATPKWDFTFREVLVSPLILRIEIWDNKRHLSSTGTFLGYAIVDWPFLRQWWKAGKSKLERRFEVLESAFHEKHEKGRSHKEAGIYLSFDYRGEKSISPEDEFLGVTEGDVSVFAKDFSKNVAQAFDDMKASIESTFAEEETKPGQLTPAQRMQLHQQANQGPTFLGIGKSDITDAFKPW